MGEYETALSLCVLMLMDPCQKETSVPSVDTCSTICKKCMGPTSDCRPNFRVLVTLNDPKKIILSENTSSKKKNLRLKSHQKTSSRTSGFPPSEKSQIERTPGLGDLNWFSVSQVSVLSKLRFPFSTLTLAF